ncbi:MAG TPA: hypothetical protein VLB90_08070, partial [Pseudomonadales bacterium]|nr:hypothetical protein [Pseudomonadales bacterium]
DEPSTQAWISTVRQEANKAGFSWAYWQFRSDFRAYDSTNKCWRRAVINALIPDKAKLTGIEEKKYQLCTSAHE